MVTKSKTKKSAVVKTKKSTKVLLEKLNVDQVRRKSIVEGHAIGFKNALNSLIAEVQRTERQLSWKPSLLDRVFRTASYKRHNQLKLTKQELHIAVDFLTRELVQNTSYFGKISDYQVYEKSLDKRINEYISR